MQIHPELMRMHYSEPDFEEDKLARENAAYRGLWASVLLQAIRDMDSAEKEERRPALHYLYDNSEDPGSFNWVCTMLDLDTERIRSMTLSRDGRRKLVGRNIGNTKPRTTNHDNFTGNNHG